MESDWIADFLALAERANFSRAAEARHLTQPAFSRRIKALEDWLGVALFDRSASPVRLTEAGRRFRPHAEDVLRGLALGRDEARAAAGLAAEALTFASTHALSLTFFPAWLRGLEPPGGLGAVHLISDSMRACEDIMARGQAQFLLCHHHPAAPGRLDTAQYRSADIGTDALVPVTAPGFGRVLEDGGAVPFLAYNDDSGMGRILAATLAARPVRLEPVFTSHLAAVLQAMARDGRGIAWLPASLVVDDLNSGQLARAGGADWDIAVAIRLVRPRARQSAAAETFWALLGG